VCGCARGHEQEVWELKHGRGLETAPDGVVFVKCHSDVEAVVAAAVQHGVCLIPFGGGTRYV